jgi:hypothetical protein
MGMHNQNIEMEIAAKKALDDHLKEKLNAAITAFKAEFLKAL